MEQEPIVRYENERRQRRKRRRRLSVSVSSSHSDECNFSTSSKKFTDRVNKKMRRSNESQVGNFTAHDVMELIKSLPFSTSQNSNHFSMNSNAVPEFDPACKEQTIESWITKVDECSSLYKWSETQLIHYALPKLTGVAKIWYQGLTSLNFTWPEWKEKLKKTFPTVQNYAQILHEMLARKVKHNESLEVYFYHKINLLNRCDITGKKAVDCLLDGLEDKGMRLGAQAANYSRPEDLLSYFKSIKVDDVKDRQMPFVRKLHDNQPDSSKPAVIRCFNCNEIGHPSFKCSKPLLTCTICKRVGHQSIDCKRLIRNSNDNT